MLFFNANAQRWIRPFENYYTTVVELDPYFDSIVQSGDTLIFNEGSEYSNYLKWKRDFGGLVAPHGDFHILAQQEYNGAHASNNAPPSNARFTDPWREIGPNRNYAPGNYIGIGPTEFLVFHPNIPNLMICGSLRAGIFSSTDSGINWSIAGTDNLEGRTGAGSATFDYNNSSTWYFTSAGQVPNGSDPTPVGLLGGVYRTQNSGVLYERIWDPNSNPNNISFRDWTVLRKIESDQNYSGTDLWLGTNNGFYHTTNCNDPIPSNVTWTNVLSGNWDVTDFELRPGTNGPQAIYAAVYDGTTRSIQYSSDHGQTWAAIPGTPSAITNLALNSGNVTLEVSPADPNLLYVLVATYGSSNSHLFVYNVNLNLWYDFPLSPSFDGSFSSGHAFAVDPLNTTIVFLPHGTSFVKINCDFSNNVYSNNSSNITTVPHDDCEDIIFNPFNNNELWLCHHGGLAVYPDKTILNVFSDRSSGLGVSIINQMSTSQSSPDYVLCGFEHDYSQLTTTPWDPQWAPLWNSYPSGDGQKPLIDPVNPNYMWISRQKNRWRSRTNLNSGFSSLFPPTNFSFSDFATFGALNPKYTNKFYRIAHDLQLDPSVGHCDEIFLSDDRGINYSVISNFNTFISTAVGIPNLLYSVLSVHLSEVNPDYMIAVVRCFPGSSQPEFNILCRTKFATQNPSQIINSWEILPICRHDNTYITDVHFDFENPEIVYVGAVSSTSSSSSNIGIGVLFRYNYSAITLGNYLQICHPVWQTDITYNLPNSSYGDFALEKGSDGGIYISTSLGIFFLNNKSITDQSYWQKIGPNLPNCRANAIEINYKINRIRVATNGRGVWEHPLVCPEDIDRTETVTYSSDQYIEVFNDINSTATINSGINIIYRAGNEIILSDGFIANEGSDFHAFIHPCDYGIPNSFKIASLNSPTENENQAITENEFFKVYPNPNNGSFSILFNEDFLASGNIELSVLDPTGRIVYQKTIYDGESDSNKIIISGLSAGVYIVSAKSKTDQLFQKTIVTN